MTFNDTKGITITAIEWATYHFLIVTVTSLSITVLRDCHFCSEHDCLWPSKVLHLRQ